MIYEEIKISFTSNKKIKSHTTLFKELSRENSCLSLNWYGIRLLFILKKTKIHAQILTQILNINT